LYERGLSSPLFRLVEGKEGPSTFGSGAKMAPVAKPIPLKALCAFIGLFEALLVTEIGLFLG
jgi:hypothetical protein